MKSVVADMSVFKGKADILAVVPLRQFLMLWTAPTLGHRGAI